MTTVSVIFLHTLRHNKHLWTLHDSCIRTDGRHCGLYYAYFPKSYVYINDLKISTGNGLKWPVEAVTCFC